MAGHPLGCQGRGVHCHSTAADHLMTSLVTRYAWTEDGYGLIPLNKAGEEIVEAVAQASPEPHDEETDSLACR